jgi:hypothetical protein
LAFWASYKIKTDYMAANYELQKRIEVQVKASDKNEKASLDKIKQIPAISRDAAKYANYGSHVGTLLAVEQGALQVASEFAQSTEIQVPGRDIPASEGGSPHLAPLYFHSLTIPRQAATGVDAFQPLATSRSIEVAFRVPEGVSPQEMNQRILQRLSDLRVSPVMWRAAYPEANVSEIPSAESLPRLFSNVVGLHIRRVDDGYVFMDPTRRDENGNPAPEPERIQQRPVLTHTLTFRCDLGPISELAALGEAKNGNK